MAKLTIIRGVPGTGKSTLAELLWESEKKESIRLEADMYFERFGEYDWKPEDISRAHNWCFDSTLVFLSKGYDVTVSNTFTRFSEMRDYILYAKKYGHKIVVTTLTEEYGSVHNVPEGTMVKMRERFESHESIMEKLMNIEVICLEE